MRHPYRSPHRSVAVMVRQRRMTGFYDTEDDDHRFIGIYHATTKMKYVVSFRNNCSAWVVLRVMIMYASVDAISLLPILILINVVAIWHVLSIFTGSASYN